ncbi:MAG: MFS transporter, partial [Candidatus Dormibacteraeota bacterium]|nr:MFS transporter [Candidatus Dormibacteraeota bacterium]
MLKQPPLRQRTIPEPPAVEPVVLSTAEIARALQPLGVAAPVVDLGAATIRRSRRPVWLTRNVAALSLTDFFADSNYEMVLAVLPLFLTIALGAPALAIGLVEGVADGSASVFKFMSGYFSDRITWRKRLGAGGYAMCAAGLGLLALVTQWPQAIGARAVAWVGRGTRQPIRSSLLAQGVPKKDMGKAFGLHEAADTLGAFVGPAIAFALLLTGHSFAFVFLVA